MDRGLRIDRSMGRQRSERILGRGLRVVADEGGWGGLVLWSRVIN